MTASCGFMWLGQRCTLELGHEEMRHVEERDGRRIASCPPLDFRSDRLREETAPDTLPVGCSGLLSEVDRSTDCVLEGT